MSPRTKAFSEVLEAEHADIWTALKGWQRFAADLETELADCQAKVKNMDELHKGLMTLSDYRYHELLDRESEVRAKLALAEKERDELQRRLNPQRAEQIAAAMAPKPCPGCDGTLRGEHNYYHAYYRCDKCGYAPVLDLAQLAYPPTPPGQVPSGETKAAVKPSVPAMDRDSPSAPESGTSPAAPMLPPEPELLLKLRAKAMRMTQLCNVMNRLDSQFDGNTVSNKQCNEARIAYHAARTMFAEALVNSWGGLDAGIDDLRQVAELLAKDAARYQWLREYGDDVAAQDGGPIWVYYDGIHMIQNEALDAAIDSAIAQQEGK